ncbi:hypothetical protein Tco_1443025 [Tanacetum coccineum]
MFEDNTYKTHEVHNDLYESLQKSVELDYSNQCLADQEEARKKKRKRRESPRTPLGSPPTQPPPPPPPAGASDAPGSKAPSSSKTAASASESMVWTTSGTQYELADTPRAQELSPTDYLMQDDSIPEEHVHLSDDEDFENDHQPKVDSRKDWWKPLPGEERPATPEPAWTIPSFNKSDMDECHKMLTDQVDWTNLEGAQVRVDVNRPLPLGGPLGHVTIQIQFFFNKDLEYLRYGSKGSNHALSISKMKAASYPDFRLELLEPEQMWIDDVCTYDISAKYGISHWWFN